MPLKDREKRREYLKAYWLKIKHSDKYPEELARHRISGAKWRASHRKEHSLAVRRCYLKRNYGLTIEQFEELLKKQKHCCAICREPMPANRNRHIDHCHSANYVRGILCTKCNTAIACLRDSSAIALEAAHYLQKNELFTA